MRLLTELRPSQDDIKNQLIDREIELRASSNSEKERLKKQLENAESENKRLREERYVHEMLGARASDQIIPT